MSNETQNETTKRHRIEEHYDEHSSANPDPGNNVLPPNVKVMTIDILADYYDEFVVNNEPGTWEIRRTDRKSQATYTGDLKHQLLRSRVHSLTSNKKTIGKELEESIKDLQDYENDIR